MSLTVDKQCPPFLPCFDALAKFLGAICPAGPCWTASRWACALRSYCCMHGGCRDHGRPSLRADVRNSCWAVCISRLRHALGPLQQSPPGDQTAQRSAVSGCAPPAGDCCARQRCPASRSARSRRVTDAVAMSHDAAQDDTLVLRVPKPRLQQPARALASLPWKRQIPHWAAAFAGTEGTGSPILSQACLFFSDAAAVCCAVCSL